MASQAPQDHGSGRLRPAAERDPYAAWRSRVERELDGADFRNSLVTRTLEGLEIEPLYTARPAPGTPDPTGFPGLWPYVRGSRPSGSAEGSWLRCPRYEESDPEALRREIVADLEGGATAVWLRLDRAARLGLEGGGPAEVQQIGRGGAAISDVSELERALGGVPLERVALFLDAGANALPAAAAVLALLEQRRTPAAEARLFFSADPLSALCRDGGLPGSLVEAQQEMGLLALHCATALPQARAVAVSTLAYHGAGAHAAQELGWALATGVHYLRCLEAAGLSPEAGARQLAFRFAVGRDLFTGVAKLRAARRLWAEVLRQCGVERPEPPFIHAVASHRTLSRRDPWVNMLRVTTQVFAAIVGGADAITSAAFDEAGGRPEVAGRRLARNTQAILAEESHLGRVVDPGGGSYYIEWRTQDLGRAAWLELQEIERRGGMAACLVSGEIRRRADETWQERRRRLEHRIDAVTGVSHFAEPPERPLERAPRPASGRPTRRARRFEPRGRAGDGGAAIEMDPRRPLEALIPAAGRGATLGELSRALTRSRDGAAEVEPWPRRRDAALFEDLREAGVAPGRAK